MGVAKEMQHIVMIAIIFAIALLYASSVRAQETLNPDRDQPLEITADQTLEWHRDTKQYIARGNVIARQGDVTIMAETLTADYRETSASAFEIYRLTADQNVKISSRGNIAYGQKAVYEVDRGVAVMTGNNLRLTSPDQSVTAKESFEYWVTEGRLTARGNAHVVRLEDTLDADTVSAIFTEDKTGTRQLKNLTADGNVRITTPTETLTGSKGRYDAASNTASINGNVKIARGPNILEGDSAEVNLTTNVSKMKGSTAGGSDGRVRGIFYPGSDANKAIQTQPAQQPIQQPAQRNTQPQQYMPRKKQTSPMLLGQ